MLEQATGKPCSLMRRGVETELFSPARRTRGADGRIVLGYVGRLSVGEEHRAAGCGSARAEGDGHRKREEFLIIGQGRR